MKNLLKRNSRKVNVSDCGTLDCSEKPVEKEVEIYKPISEDTEKLKDQNKKLASSNKGKNVHNKKHQQIYIYVCTYFKV